MAVQTRAVLLIAASLFACRGEREAPAEGTAIGGGPTAQPAVRAVTPGLALEKLREARCDRTRTCGIVGAGCAGDTSAIYEPTLKQCDRGVRAAALDACAEHIRNTPCSSMVAVAEACSARSLCDGM